VRQGASRLGVAGDWIATTSDSLRYFEIRDATIICVIALLPWMCFGTEVGTPCWSLATD
jgi:hypothetical protein